MQARFTTTVTPQDAVGYVDVLIVGAGISGLDAAYRLTERDPHLTHAILERRARIGGTWDLFRYPGVRSDSSIFTLSLPFEPWTRKEVVADGESASTSSPPRTSTASTAASGSTATSAQRTGIHQPTPGRSPSSKTARASSTTAGSYSSAAATTTTTRANPRLSRHRAVRRHRHTPAALAGGPRLCRQEDRGDRQRRHRDRPDPSAGRAGRKSDHAAALADLHRLGVQVRQGCRGVS